MPTLQDHFLATQIIQNLGRLAPNMQDNAAAYKANAKGKSAAALATEINADMDEFLRRIGWIESLATRNLSQMTASLQALGITVASANADKNAMKNAATAMKAATKTTQAEINTASDTMMAAVPTYERIF
jgi:hypothetical protein